MSRTAISVPGVAGHDLDVAQGKLRYELGGHGEVRWIGVNADDPPAWRHPVRQQPDDPARAAAEIDRTVAGPQANPIEQGCAVGRQLVGLTLQARTLTAATAERVDHVGIEVDFGG
jgi:hypothetical protein